MGRTVENVMPNQVLNLALKQVQGDKIVTVTQSLKGVGDLEMKKRTGANKKDGVTQKEITYRPIGIIHTPFVGTEGTPNQPTAGKDIEGMIDIAPEYIEGLSDLEGFSHIILIYHFHLSADYSLKIKPFRHDHIRGVFATRSPRRPNPIGMSVVRLVKIDAEKIYVKDVDVVDGTPLLDIKPYSRMITEKFCKSDGFPKR